MKNSKNKADDKKYSFNLVKKLTLFTIPLVIIVIIIILIRIALN